MESKKRVVILGCIFSFVLALLTTPILVRRLTAGSDLADLNRVILFGLNLLTILVLVSIFLVLDWVCRNHNWVNHFFNMIFDLLGNKTIWVSLAVAAAAYWLLLNGITASVPLSRLLVSLAH